MSESERMPGYRNRSHVPPIAWRPSSMTKLFVGHSIFRWQAPPTPDSPAPTIMTSTCSTVGETIYQPQRSTKGGKILLNNSCILCVLWLSGIKWMGPGEVYDVIRSSDFAVGGGVVWSARAGDYRFFARWLPGVDRAWFCRRRCGHVASPR